MKSGAYPKTPETKSPLRPGEVSGPRFGPGTLANLGTEAVKFGQKALLVTDKNIRKAGYADRAARRGLRLHVPARPVEPRDEPDHADGAEPVDDVRPRQPRGDLDPHRDPAMSPAAGDGAAGAPRRKRIYLSVPHMGGSEERYVREAFASVGRGADTRGVVLELRRKDNGQPVWVQWWSKPEPDGKFTRTMLVDMIGDYRSLPERYTLDVLDLVDELAVAPLPLDVEPAVARVHGDAQAAG